MVESEGNALYHALRNVKYPGYSRDIVSFGMVKDVSVEGTTARITLAIGQLQPDIQQTIEADVAAVIAAVPGIEGVELAISTPAQARPAGRAGGSTTEAVPGVKHIVAVASGKGGVGKSTVAVNLATALALRGMRTGIVDADIYGPNVPRMLGVTHLPPASNRKIMPAEAHGVAVISLAFFARSGEPIVWRGPMIDKAIRQFFHDVDWGERDIIVVDLPPGTGDASLSLVQRLPIDGALIVSTPQQVALDDAQRALAMFQNMRVPILGLIENMSYFVCPDCGGRHPVFGHGDARQAAEQLGIPLLARLPLEATVGAGGDRGAPAVLDPGSEVGRLLQKAADAVLAELTPAEGTALAESR